MIKIVKMVWGVNVVIEFDDKEIMIFGMSELEVKEKLDNVEVILLVDRENEVMYRCNMVMDEGWYREVLGYRKGECKEEYWLDYSIV